MPFRSTASPTTRRPGASALVRALAVAALAAPAAAAQPYVALDGDGADAAVAAPAPTNPLRVRAERDRGLRIMVSLDERKLLVMSQADTLLAAPVAVGSGAKLKGLDRSWTFETPKGVRQVIGKRTDPVWTPPDWMYVETAQEHGLKLQRVVPGKPVALPGGMKLVVRRDVMGVLEANGKFTPIPDGEHAVYGDVLYIPPLGTKNRRIPGELGKFALDTGDGILLHGTPYQSTVGQKVSHGCVRLRDEDIAWLHRHVPVGTRVYLY
jgi:lipoprotein-anchoring transpeptidase ErfK/SrfK